LFILLIFNGYIGPSASFEIGYFFAHGITVFALQQSEELCIEYIDDIKTPEEVVQVIKNQQQNDRKREDKHL